MLKLSDFDYHLPESLIALEPSANRTDARLLHVTKEDKKLTRSFFRDLPAYLQEGDVLVLNNTKVIPARIVGRRQTGGKVEALLMKKITEDSWTALVKPSGRLKKGEMVEFGENGVRLNARMADEPSEGGQRVLTFCEDQNRLAEKLSGIGHVPLPPYIRRADHAKDRENYQTVFAEKAGAIAAPTAGLHFDQTLLETLRKKKVEIAFVTLHVSYGTFQPITAENLTEHRIEEEEYEITAENAELVNKALVQGRRIIACGTTAVRALETAGTTGKVKAGKGITNLFVFPPFEFKIVKGLITNFHLPKSSLLLLVAAFLGSHRALNEIYQKAIEWKFRFYSYGDAMVIL